MDDKDLEIVKPIIEHYNTSFLQKTYGQENNDYDFLMNLYNISPDLKRENRQYWGAGAWNALATACDCDC